MSRRRAARIVAYLVVVLTVGLAIRGFGHARSPRPMPGLRDTLMRTLGDASIVRADTGEGLRLSALGDRRAIAIVFSGIGCPVSEALAPTLAEIERAYRGRGVAVLVVDANAHDAAAEVASHAADHGIAFPVYRDPGNTLADRLLAERTCEAFVLDAARRIRYRGAVDDQYGRGARRDRPAHRYLADALDAVLDGREVATPMTPVVGCPIERVEARPASARTPRRRPVASIGADAGSRGEGRIGPGPVTYSADVAPILQRRCQACHRPRQVGPFSLLTFEDARRWAGAIREAVEDRRMPPWHADPAHGRFGNDRSLSPAEREAVIAWVDQGTPQGDPDSEPPARSFAEGWTIGRPDVVFEMTEPFVVPASGTVPYQRFRVPTNFAEGRWVRAIEGRPGDRSIVHHLLVYVHRPDPDARAISRTGPHLVTYAPGDDPAVYPPGTAKYIPAGSELMFELHYTPTGRVAIDRSSVGLIFADGPVERLAVSRGIPGRDLRIPPGAPAHPVRSSMTFEADARLLSMSPHMHLRGKDFRYTATYPDGSSEILLSVPAYDFAWQSVYRLAEPRTMPRGTRIDCLAHFDNSAANPSNPDPSKTVAWGDQSWEEMMTGYVDYSEALPAPADRRRVPPQR